MPINPKRVSVFIDHSNVVHRLSEVRKIDPQWVRWYDPEKLANKLKGNRQLVGIYFYCAPPPPYLLQGNRADQKKYWKQMSYYEAIKKIRSVELKFATLKGTRGDLREKNLDTQLNSDLILKSVRNEFDTAILVSNDGDNVSGVEGAKELGRKVELVFFRQRLSMDVKRACDVTRRARRIFFGPLEFDIEEQL